jgi:hypothetical protein
VRHNPTVDPFMVLAVGTLSHRSPKSASPVTTRQWTISFPRLEWWSKRVGAEYGPADTVMASPVTSFRNG